MSLPPAVARLIEALAEQDAGDYLREIGAESGPAGETAENPVLPATDRAA